MEEYQIDIDTENENVGARIDKYLSDALNHC